MVTAEGEVALFFFFQNFHCTAGLGGRAGASCSPLPVPLCCSSLDAMSAAVLPSKVMFPAPIAPVPLRERGDPSGEGVCGPSGRKIARLFAGARDRGRSSICTSMSPESRDERWVGSERLD